MLKEYKKKRNFSNTPEPSGRKQVAGKQLRFVVQRHDATRLHYDFRLELDGVLKSWAVPKGPSMNSADKRLAVHVEDHPVDYINFHGIIPEGNYGAGVVQVWDHGFYIPVNAEIEPITEKEALKWLEKGELKFVIKGSKLSGEFVLVRLKRDEKNWLLIKHNDEFAVKTKYDAEKLIKGQSKKEIFEKGAGKLAVWESNRPAKAASKKSGARKNAPASKKNAAVKPATKSGEKPSSKAVTRSASILTPKTAKKSVKPAAKKTAKPVKKAASKSARKTATKRAYAGKKNR
ncbi:MAG: DNA polymerase ligase N-terminal domain-containing protein [Pseudobacter sp.]|uniref:DNA polymerase ligase N-terminal domain-containing protein n=1 Tax=Pseudobacter sp. TaxID=2045420 RepID=UPI003F7FA63E